MKKPNFFIIGAPKCGTTTISEWLRSHPNVFFSRPKELDYFDTDHRKRYQDTWSRYLSYFEDATNKHLAVGEASIGYLRSEVAVPSIIKVFPRAKFVVCVRNPVRMAISWHNQMLNTGWENVTSFDEAWRIQTERKMGRKIPRICPEPTNLFYGDVCALGTQLERVLTIIPRNQLHMIVLDDLVADPKNIYVKLLNFLGLPEDERTHFPAANAARKLPRSFALFARVAIDMKQSLGIRRGFGIMSMISRMIETEARNEGNSIDIAKIEAYFEPEINKLEKILHRDFSYWQLHPNGRTIS